MESKCLPKKISLPQNISIECHESDIDDIDHLSNRRTEQLTNF
jgi:hypothetical protein